MSLWSNTMSVVGKYALVLIFFSSATMAQTTPPPAKIPIEDFFGNEKSVGAGHRVCDQ